MLEETLSPHEPIFSFRRHEFPVTTLDISTDNKLMLSGDLSGNCILWDFTTRLPLKKWKAHKGQILLVKFLSIHWLLTVGRAESITLWKLDTNCTSTSDPPIYYSQMQLLSHSLCPPSVLPCTCFDSLIFEMFEQNTFLIATPGSLEDNTFDVYSIDINSNGKTFLPLQKNIGTSSLPTKDKFVTSLCFYPSTKPRLVVGYTNGYFSHWELISNRPSLLSTFSFSSQPITALCTDNKQKIGIAGGFGPAIHIFELFPMKPSDAPIVSSLEVEAEGTSWIAFRKDNKKFAVAGYDNKVRVFSRNGKLLSILDIGTSKINWIQFSQSCTQSSTFDIQPNIWNVRTTNLLAIATQDCKIFLYKT